MSPKYIKRILVAIPVAFIIYGTTVWLVFGKPDGAGTFGDMFGGFNALFAALAGVGVVMAILIQLEQLTIQRNELALQREELRLQRDEMAKSREQLAEQARVQQLSFWSTVVQLKFEALKCGNMADEMESLNNIPGTRTQWINKIRNRERIMTGYIEELESREGPKNGG
jgi:hypothetical protein